MEAGMFAISKAESLMLLTVAMFWIVPMAAAVWALLTLHRIRSVQEGMRQQLDAVARVMHRPI